MRDADVTLTLAWRKLCDRSGALGDRLRTRPFPEDGLDRAASVRHLDQARCNIRSE